MYKRQVYTGTRVARLEESGKRLVATFEGVGAPAKPQTFDRVLVAVGRHPNGRSVGAEKAGVMIDERGFIPVNRRQQTNIPHIYAIGDICGEPMLAHKASYEGRIAAEAIAGLQTEYDALTVPSVAYTDPEIAWMGLDVYKRQTQMRSSNSASVKLASYFSRMERIPFALQARSLFST